MMQQELLQAGCFHHGPTSVIQALKINLLNWPCWHSGTILRSHPLDLQPFEQ